MKEKIFFCFFLTLHFCNYEPTTPGQDGKEGPPGPPGPMGEKGDPSFSVTHDGYRISTRYITTNDGYQMPYGLFDKQRGEPCDWVKVDDNIKCLPAFIQFSIASTELGFLDSDCKMPVYIPRAGQAPNLNFCPFNGPIKYVLANGVTGYDFCPIPLWNTLSFPEFKTKSATLFSLGPIVTVSGRLDFYFLTSTSPNKCQNYPVMPAFYYPLTPIDPSEFADGKIKNP